jgi:putative membrane protein
MQKAFVVLAAVVALGGCGENDKEDFAKKARESGQYEVTSSELAQEKSKRDDVKAFAAEMIADHTAAGKKLEQISAEAGVTTVEKGVGQKTEYTDELEELQKAADFDAEYIDQQVTAHEDAVILFESYGQDGDDAKLKAFAAETLPTLKRHLEHVKKLKDAAR